MTDYDDDDYGDERRDWGLGDWDEGNALNDLAEAILSERGLGHPGTLVIHEGMLEDAGDLRGRVFTSVEEAIDYLIQTTTLSFSSIVYIGDDMYMVAIPEDSPGVQ